MFKTETELLSIAKLTKYHEIRECAMKNLKRNGKIFMMRINGHQKRWDEQQRRFKIQKRPALQ